MRKVYAELIKARLEQVTGAIAQVIKGLIYFRSDINRPYIDDGTDVSQLMMEKHLPEARRNTKVQFDDTGTGNEVEGVVPVSKGGTNLSSLTGFAGQALVVNDTETGYEFGESGGGGLDVFHTEDFELTNVADLTTGNDATFLGGGVFAGTLADVNTIAGDSNLRYTQAAGSLNDYFVSPVFDIDPKQAGNDCGLSFYFKYNGNDGDIKAVVYDATNNTVISDSLDLIKSASNPTRFETSVFIPAGVTSLRWGIQVVSLNNGAVLELDDVEFSTSPFAYKNIVEEQAYEAYEGNGKGSTNTGIRRFANVRTDKGAGLFSVNTANETTDGLEITFLKDCYVDVVYQDVETGGGGSTYGIGINSSDLISGWVNIPYASRLSGMSVTGGSTAAHVNHGGSSWSGYVQAGDVIRPHGASSDDSASFGITRFSIKARVSSTHVITPAKANLTEWEVYASPSFVGFGSPTNVEIFTRRVGDELEMRGRFTAGTVAGVAAGIQLPSGLNIDTSKSTTFSNTTVGHYFRALNTTLHGGSMLTTSAPANIVYFGSSSGFSGSSANAMNQGTGTGSFANNDNVSFTCRVPIAEWVGESTTFLAAIPVKKTCYVKDVKANTINGGTFTSGSFQTRDLNTLEGDTSFASISANQLTLQIGTYDIDFSVPGRNVDSHKARLQNITDGATAILGSNANTPNGGFSQNDSNIKGRITITSQKVFEVQHRCTTTVAATGFGVNNGFGVDEVYTQGTITKVK
jgi:hypothetical protein